jgi:hypothetical protein
VPDVARKKIAVSARHPLFLEAHFRRQKAASKPLKDAFYATFICKINKFPWSDPELVSMSLYPCLALIIHAVGVHYAAIALSIMLKALEVGHAVALVAKDIAPVITPSDHMI